MLIFSGFPDTYTEEKQLSELGFNSDTGISEDTQEFWTTNGNLDEMDNSSKVQHNYDLTDTEDTTTTEMDLNSTQSAPIISLDNGISESKSPEMVHIPILTKEGDLWQYLSVPKTQDHNDDKTQSQPMIQQENSAKGRMGFEPEQEEAVDYSINNVNKEVAATESRLIPLNQTGLGNMMKLQSRKSKASEDVKIHPYNPRRRRKKPKATSTFIPIMKPYEEEGYGRKQSPNVEKYEMDKEDEDIIMNIWKENGKKQEQDFMKRKQKQDESQRNKNITEDKIWISANENPKRMDDKKDDKMESTNDESIHRSTQTKEERSTTDESLSDKKNEECQTDVSLIDKGGPDVEWVAIKVENAEINPEESKRNPNNIYAVQQPNEKSIQTLPVKIKQVTRKKRHPLQQHGMVATPNYQLPSLNDSDEDAGEEDRNPGEKRARNFNLVVDVASASWEDNTDSEDDVNDFTFTPPSRNYVEIKRIYNTRCKEQKKAIERFGHQLPSQLALNDITIQGTMEEQIDEEHTLKQNKADKDDNERRKQEAAELLKSLNQDKSTQTTLRTRSIGTTTVQPYAQSTSSTQTAMQLDDMKHNDANNQTELNDTEVDCF